MSNTPSIFHLSASAAKRHGVYEGLLHAKKLIPLKHKLHQMIEETQAGCPAGRHLESEESAVPFIPVVFS